MPVHYHPDVELTAGVPWTIAGQLCNAKGQAFDVTNAQLTWVLLNAESWVVPMTASITKTDPVNGAISIEVAKTDTALAPGRYTDALQIREGTGTGLYWIREYLRQRKPVHANLTTSVPEMAVNPKHPPGPPMTLGNMRR
jgi:hypothetical protein